jgi:hypothetical protein
MAGCLVVLTLLYLLPGVIAWGRLYPQRLATRLFTLVAG